MDVRRAAATALEVECVDGAPVESLVCPRRSRPRWACRVDADLEVGLLGHLERVRIARRGGARVLVDLEARAPRNTCSTMGPRARVALPMSSRS